MLGRGCRFVVKPEVQGVIAPLINENGFVAVSPRAVVHRFVRGALCPFRRRLFGVAHKDSDTPCDRLLCRIVMVAPSSIRMYFRSPTFVGLSVLYIFTVLFL